MNKNSNKVVTCTFIMVLFIGAACLLRTLACDTALDEGLIYFEKNSLLFPANVLAVIGAVLLFTLSMSMKKDAIRLSFTSPLAYIPSGIIATALILFMLKMLSVFLDLSASSPIQSQIPTSAWLALGCMILAPLSALHFFLSAFISEREASLRAYFALATILLPALYASFLYFSTDTPLNAPNKVLEQMAFLFAAIFLLYEARISLGRELLRMYTAFGLVATLLTAYASIPSLLIFFMNGTVITYSIESAVLLFAMSIFIFTRLCLVMSAAHDGESSEMSALREYAERRAEELACKTVEDGTQISIDDLIDLTPIVQENAEEVKEETSEENTVTEENTTAEEATAEETAIIEEDIVEENEILEEVAANEMTDEIDTPEEDFDGETDQSAAKEVTE